MSSAEHVIQRLTKVKGDVVGKEGEPSMAAQFRQGAESDFGEYGQRANRLFEALGTVLAEMQRLKSDVQTTIPQTLFTANEYQDSSRNVANITADGSRLQPAITNLSMAGGIMETATVKAIAFQDFLEASIGSITPMTTTMEEQAKTLAGPQTGQAAQIERAGGNVNAAMGSIDAQIAWLRAAQAWGA
jgi:hypothetical protein